MNLPSPYNEVDEIARLKTRVQEQHKEIEHLHEVIDSIELNLQNALEDSEDKDNQIDLLYQDNADLKSALALLEELT
jgi:hypothetical protein